VGFAGCASGEGVLALLCAEGCAGTVTVGGVAALLSARFDAHAATSKAAVAINGTRERGRRKKSEMEMRAGEAAPFGFSIIEALPIWARLIATAAPPSKRCAACTGLSGPSNENCELKRALSSLEPSCPAQRSYFAKAFRREGCGDETAALAEASAHAADARLARQGFPSWFVRNLVADEDFSQGGGETRRDFEHDKNPPRLPVSL
jgi:hypothetical protein